MLVSVIIPTKDRAKKLERTLSSVLSQSYKNLEIIVIENNSEKEGLVEEVARSFGDSRIIYKRLEHCRNANEARNYGISVASGDYIAMLDSDDEYMEVHLAECVELASSGSFDFIYGSCVINDGETHILRHARDFLKNEEPTDYLFGEERAWAPTPTFFFKREISKKVTWDEDLYRHQDFDYFIKVSKKFKCKAKQNATVIVNWQKNEKRSYDSGSMRYFYKKWSRKMNKYSKRVYSRDKLSKAIKNRDTKNFIFFSMIYLRNLI